MYNTKPIIDLMARYNNGCISKQALIFICQYVSREDKDYIESAGYTLVDHYAEKPKFDLAEIRACFDLYETTGDVSAIVYCRSLFEFFFIKKTLEEDNSFCSSSSTTTVLCFLVDRNSLERLESDV